MTWTPIDFNAGFYPDDTPRTAAGFFTSGDKVRFVRKKAQTIGGWESASTDLVHGICRGMFGWRSNDTLPQAAIGTNTHLQAYYDGDIYDITPVVSFTTPTFDITTVNAALTVTLSGLTHSLVEDQRFVLDNSSPATVGGVTLDAEFEVLEVLSATAITFTAASAATSSAGPTSVTADMNAYLAPGLIDGLAGIGFGVGPFGGGDYGEPGEISQLFPRTWSLDQWSQNLLACPRGGSIYEWAPAYSNPELVVNGGFDTDTDWTKGTGWTIAAGVATATPGFSSLLTSQLSLELESNAYNLLEFDLTRVAGTLTPELGSTAIGAAIDATGRYRRAFYTGDGGTLSFHKDASFGGTVDNVSVKQLLTARILPGAPTENTCILVTPELITLAFGTIDADTSVFNPMQIRSSDTGDGDLSANQTWSIDPGNAARRWNLSKGSRIVRGLNGNGEVLCWTDTALYAGVFTPGDSNTVYRWRLVAEGCGLAGPNAVTVENGIARWITPSFDVMEYAGGLPRSLDAPIIRDFKENIAPSQQDKIYGFSIGFFGEHWFLYPDFRDGNECSRYVQYNARGGVWANGTFDRTAWMDTGAFVLPIATDTEGNLFWQEKGKSANGGALTWSITTASLSNGRDLTEIMGFTADFEDMVGGCSMYVNAAEVPNGTVQVFGPYSITSQTENLDVRAVGYSPTLTFTGTSAPAFMRMGSHQIDIKKTGAFR